MTSAGYWYLAFFAFGMLLGWVVVKGFSDE